MRFLIIFIFLLLSLPLLAEEDRRWQSTIALPGNKQAVLYWIAVYEGFESVEAIRVVELPSKSLLREFKALGQPTFSKDNRLVALPYCAHDGCQEEVVVIDLAGQVEPTRFNYQRTGQTVTFEWTNTEELEIRDITH